MGARTLVRVCLPLDVPMVPYAPWDGSKYMLEMTEHNALREGTLRGGGLEKINFLLSSSLSNRSACPPRSV